MNIVNARRGMGKGMNLPYDAEVDYIECKGQSITFPVIANQIYGLRFYYRYNKNPTIAVSPRVAYTSDLGFFVGYHYGQTRGYYRINPMTSDSLTFFNIWSCFKTSVQTTDDNSVLSLNGYTASYTPPISTSTTGKFAIGTQGQYGEIILLGQDGVPIFQGIPVRSNGVGYIYDKISKQLYGSNTNTPCTYGKDVQSSVYDAEVSYIDISDKYLDIDVDAHTIYGVQYSMVWNAGNGRTIMKGGDFSISQANANGAAAVEIQGEVTTTGNGAVANASNGNGLFSISSQYDTQSNPNRMRLTQSSGQYVTTTTPFSSISENISLFKEGNYGVRISQLIFMDASKDIVFWGIPVRKNGEGMLYDIKSGNLYSWQGEGTGYGYGPDIKWRW